MNRSSDFSRELQRSFEVHENCYGCVEFYYGCNAWPESRTFACADYYPLPPVGVNGKTGQEIPPSRMNGRTEPGAHRDPAVPRELDAALSATARRSSRRTAERSRRPSPVSVRGPAGEHLCQCGATIRKRQRCCGSCRLQRRQETLRNRGWQERTSRVTEPIDLRRREATSDGAGSTRTINLTYDPPDSSAMEDGVSYGLMSRPVAWGALAAEK